MPISLELRELGDPHLEFGGLARSQIRAKDCARAARSTSGSGPPGASASTWVS